MFKYVYQLLLLHHIVYEKFEDDRAVAINKQTDYDLQNTESENKD